MNNFQRMEIIYEKQRKTTLALKAIGVENNKKYYDMNQILTYAKFSE